MNPHHFVNAVLFQLTWFACVLGGAQGTSLWGAAAVMPLLAHSAVCGSLSRDLTLAGIAAAVGFGIDTAWIGGGVLSYGGAPVAPVWIVLLWAAVGLSLEHSFSVFKARPWLGGALAGLAAPLSYLTGDAFGAVTVPDARLLVPISAVWMLMFAVAFSLTGRRARPTAPLEESS